MSKVHITTGQYVLCNVSTNTFLNARNYEVGLGTKVSMSDGTKMYTNDRWNVVGNLSVQQGYNCTYTLESTAVLALAVPDPQYKNLVTGNDITTQWILTPGSAPFSYAIKHVQSGQVLQPAGGNAGADVLLANPNTSPVQSWFIIPADYQELNWGHGF